MSQPVKLSDELVLAARTTGEVFERSIAGQIEFWALLGRAIEPLLQGSHLAALKLSVPRRSLEECLTEVETPAGRRRIADYLAQQPFPHYSESDAHPGRLVRTEADGSQTVGRFVNRQWVPDPE